MTMIIGAVTLDDTGTATTATGLAGALWASRSPLLLASVAAGYTAIGKTWPGLIPNGPTLPALQNLAASCVADSTAIVTYIQANAHATISTSQSCGVMPSSTAAGTPLGAPATAVALPIS